MVPNRKKSPEIVQFLARFIFQGYLPALPFPVTARPLFTKYVKLLQAYCIISAFHEFLCDWNFGGILTFVSGDCSRFIYKICQIVAGISIISAFHEFFCDWKFWRDFAIWPNCAQAQFPVFCQESVIKLHLLNNWDIFTFSPEICIFSSTADS